jgi:prophage DNA circulation protein
MLDWIERISKERLDPNSARYKFLMQAIAKARKNEYETSFMDQMVEDFKNSDAVKFLDEEGKKISDSLFSPIKDEAEELKNKPEEMKKKLLESLRDARTSANNSLGTVFKGGMEQFDKIQKHLDDKMNDVRSLIITPNNNNDAPASAPPPASSWNEDFLKNDYFASTYEKWWRIG